MENEITNRYAFVLGRDKEIALVELEAVLHRYFCHAELDSASCDGIPGRAQILKRVQDDAKASARDDCRRFCFTKPIVTGNVAVINIENTEANEVAKLAGILGGTIKIFRLINTEMDDPPTGEPGEHLNNERQTLSNCHSERNAVKSRNLLKDPSASVGMTGDMVGMTHSKLAMTIANIIKAKKTGQSGKINFGISLYSDEIRKSEIYTLGLEVKRLIKSTHSARFIESRQEDALSSIVSLKNDLTGRGIEIGLFDLDNTYCSSLSRTDKSSDRDKDFSLRSKNIGLGVLIGLSNPEKWSERDYGKPASDKYSGMVPHKLARMMVNISLGLRTQDLGPSETKTCDLRPKSYVVLDPFCGSGNILMEAAMLGCDVIGSDISDKAVSDSKKNIDWLIREMSKSKFQMSNKIPNTKVFQVDATSNELVAKLDSYIITHDSAVVVTEPYLGEPKKFMPSQSAAAGEYRKVKELYLSFLRNLSHLGDLSVICIIFPLVETTENKRYSLYQESIDEIKSLGYIEECPPLIYGREYQVVKREIVFLRSEIRNPNIETNSNI